MKTNFSFYSLILILSGLIFSCTTDSDDGGINATTQQMINIANTAQSGVWHISSFIDSGQNETTDFTGYNFTFGLNGMLEASNGGNTESGNWSVTNGSNSSSSNIDFNISFSVPDTSVFDDLNDDWDIVSYTETTIDLIDISGGNGGTDTLTFERN